MRMHRYFALAILPLIWFGVALARMFDSALAYFRPEPMTFAGATPAYARVIDGRPLGSSLLNSLRHEAGLPRRSADRKT